MIIRRNSETHRKRDAEKVRLTLLKETPSSHIRESQHRNKKQRQTTRKLTLGIIDSSSIFAPPRVVYNASLWPFEFTLSPSTWAYCSSTRCLHYRSVTSAHDPMNPWARITLWQHYEFIVSCNDEYECGNVWIIEKGYNVFFNTLLYYDHQRHTPGGPGRLYSYRRYDSTGMGQVTIVPALRRANGFWRWVLKGPLLA